MDIGLMRKSGSLYINQPTTDAAGGQADNFVLVLTCRGYLQKSSGMLALLAGQFNTNKSFLWTVRYQISIAINNESQWQIGSNTYRVVDWTKIDEIPHFYEFNLEKQ